MEIHDETLKQEAINLMRNRGNIVINYNPFDSKQVSQALSTKDGIRSGRYISLLSNNNKNPYASKFIDEVDYAGSRGQIMIPRKTPSTGIEDTLHEGGHIENSYRFPHSIISNVANYSRDGFNSTSPDIETTGGVLKNIRRLVTRPIGRAAIKFDESRASKDAIKSLKQLNGVTKQNIDSAKEYYKTALSAYKERGKAYVKEPLKELMIKITPLRKRK